MSGSSPRASVAVHSRNTLDVRALLALYGSILSLSARAKRITKLLAARAGESTDPKVVRIADLSRSRPVFRVLECGGGRLPLRFRSCRQAKVRRESACDRTLGLAPDKLFHVFAPESQQFADSHRGNSGLFRGGVILYPIDRHIEPRGDFSRRQKASAGRWFASMLSINQNRVFAKIGRANLQRNAYHSDIAANPF